jgi:hypothetical protein
MMLALNINMKIQQFISLKSLILFVKEPWFKAFASSSFTPMSHQFVHPTPIAQYLYLPYPW